MHLETAMMSPSFALAPWVVFLPVIGLVVNLLLGRRLGEKGIGAVASLAAAGSFGVAIALALALSRQPEGASVPLLDWFTVGDLSVRWAFRVDTLAVTMMLVVSGVGAIIHVYSIGYMHSDVRHNGDPQRFRRFFVYLNLFIAMMMLLVSADNYLVLFIGWEGVGLCSYLLIGFWFEKGQDGIGNARAAMKAFVVNRIGDFGLLLALFFLFWNFRSFDFAVIFSRAPEVAAAAPWVVLAITLFMLLGVTGKSAQLPLYVWLPDAMAGPTPVSALIHAATMVTAGVYLVARSQALFALVPAAQSAVTWVGAATALFAATIAVGQYDIKKVLAYSTISQLGFMVAAVGMGATVAGMFHLVTHAFFKALLFLAAGSVILGMEHGSGHAEAGLDPQDMRNMGGLRARMPLTFWVYLIGALTLAGIAPLAGFFSKDEILAAASRQAPAVFGILLLAAFFTAFYMGRQVLLIFFGRPRSAAASQAVESPALVTVPLAALALLSIAGGALNFPGSHILETWLEHSLAGVKAGRFLWPVAVGSLALALAGILIAWLIYGRKPLPDAGAPDPLARPLGAIYRGMERKWKVDEFYHLAVVRPYRALAGFLAGPVDQNAIDWLVNGVARLLVWVSQRVRKIQTGYVRTYALAVLAGVVAVLAYLAAVAFR